MACIYFYVEVVLVVMVADSPTKRFWVRSPMCDELILNDIQLQ